jgi:hypothetical protein
VLKVCEICGEEFETIYPNKKYCTIICSAEAEREANRLRKRKVRGQVKEYYNTKEQGKSKIELMQKEIAESLERQHIENEEQARQGNPKAIMKIHSMYDVEYWEAYKQIFLADKYNDNYTYFINDIDLREKNSPKKIAKSIPERGKVFSQLKRIK